MTTTLALTDDILRLRKQVADLQAENARLKSCIPPADMMEGAAVCHEFVAINRRENQQTYQGYLLQARRCRKLAEWIREVLDDK